MSAVQDRKELERYLAKLKTIADASQVDITETESTKKARISRAKRDYNYFVGYYFPHFAECDCAPFHIEEANRVLRDKNISLVEEWARGHAKSTHFDIFIPIWLHLFHDQLDCMLLVGKNEKSAQRLLSDVQAEFAENPQLKHDFGTLMQYGSWEAGSFAVRTGAAFFALGKGQSPRGLRNGSKRPDFIVVDDIDDDEECRNPRRVDETTDWILRALIPAMGTERTRFVMVNNRIGSYTVLGKLVGNKHFKHRKVNAIGDDGQPAWPAKYTLEWFERRKNIIGWAAFETEYQNNPQIAGKIFVDKYIQLRPRLRLNQYERIVAYWDVAYSEAKTADCNAIIIAGLYGIEKHIIKAYCRQSTMEDALRWMYAIQMRMPKTVQIEWYGESQFWNNAVEIAMQTIAKENTFRLPISFIDRAGRGTNKYSRMIQMLPAFQRGEIYFAEEEKHNNDMQAAIAQLKAIEPGYKTHDDAPDAMEAAINKLEATRAVADYEPTIGHNSKSYSKIF